MKKFLLAVGLAGATPLFALAQSQQISNTFNNLNATANSAGGFVGGLTRLVNTAVPLLLAIAIVVFIWTIIKFLYAKGGTEKNAARNYMIFAVIAIAVILSILGLANFLIGFFGIQTGNGGLSGSNLPCVPVNGTSC